MNTVATFTRMADHHLSDSYVDWEVREASVRSKGGYDERRLDGQCWVHGNK